MLIPIPQNNNNIVKYDPEVYKFQVHFQPPYFFDHTTYSLPNTLRPRQDGQHFADDIFRHIFVNEKFCILSKISLKFVPKDPINNNPALV